MYLQNYIAKDIKIYFNSKKNFYLPSTLTDVKKKKKKQLDKFFKDLHNKNEKFSRDHKQRNNIYDLKRITSNKI